MKKKLQQLVKNGTLKSFKLKTGIPTCPGDTKSRLIDVLTLTFPDNEQLKLTAICSGCLENVTLELV